MGRRGLGDADAIGDPVSGAGGTAGAIAGVLIGVLAALTDAPGAELLIPTIVLLSGVDFKIAGSLLLAVSLPTMLVAFSATAETRARVNKLRREVAQHAANRKRGDRCQPGHWPLSG